MRKKLKVGILGCGAIGSYLARKIAQELKEDMQISGLCDINSLAADNLSNSFLKKIPIYSASELIAKSDLIIEATSIKSCSQLLNQVISKGKDILVMSVGALLQKNNILKCAQKTGSTIYIPSGAIAGTDALQAARVGKIKAVQLVTTKPALAFSGVRYLKERGIKPEKIKKRTLLFVGNASEAVRNFPQNINVAALVALCTQGPKKTKVKIIADPHLKENVHEIRLSADCGDIITRTENLASRSNPKTSYLAMLSAFATLKSIVSPIKIGI